MASVEILRQNIATQNVTSPVGAPLMAEVTGQYRGQNVRRTDENSKLADAAEELGMSVAHLSNKRSLGDRKIRQGQGFSPEAAARIRAYYDKLPNMPREAQLKALVDQFESFMELLNESGGGAGGPTKEAVLAALQQFDSDVTHQYAALEIARDYFEATGASVEFQNLLDEARAEYQSGDVARDVHAGFAAAEVASQAAATLETDPATVRDLYRAMLRESPNLGQLFDALSKFDLLKTFDEAVETFTTAAGRDLANAGPSTDPMFLHSLLTELGKLKKMRTMLEATQQLALTTDRLLDPVDRGKADAIELTSLLINFVSRTPVTLADARALLGRFKLARLAAQLAYANGVRGLHGDVPDEVMPSPQARQQQLSTLLRLLDELVAREDEEYEEAHKDPRDGGKRRVEPGRDSSASP